MGCCPTSHEQTGLGCFCRDGLPFVSEDGGGRTRDRGVTGRLGGQCRLRYYQTKPISWIPLHARHASQCEKYSKEENRLKPLHTGANPPEERKVVYKINEDVLLTKAKQNKKVREEDGKWRKLKKQRQGSEVDRWEETFFLQKQYYMKTNTKTERAEVVGLKQRWIPEPGTLDPHRP